MAILNTTQINTQPPLSNPNINLKNILKASQPPTVHDTPIPKTPADEIGCTK
jgi:hypothetical protein